MNIEVRVKVFNKLQIFKQKIWNFWNFIDKFDWFILEIKGFLDDKIKKNFYKKGLNNYLIMVILSINNTGIFEVYKTWFIIIDDCIVRYNINYKRFLFGISLKSETMGLIIKSVEKNIMNWEVAVAIFQ